MLTRGKLERGVVEMVDTENLVPTDHLLRKIDAAVDFGKLYELVEPLYSEEEGRYSIDPVVLFKIVLIQHLDGIASLRGTLRRAQTDVAYRWVLGYTLSEELPHFSTVSYNFRHRFTEETIEAVFQWILDEAGSAGALSPAAVFIDGTHIKASANLKKKIKQEVPVAAKRYRDELLAEINADREAHGKKPLDDDDKDPPKSAGKRRDNTSKKKQARRKKAGFKTVTKSTTDLDCGMFVKGEHERQFAYEAHTACDKNGYVLATVVTPGNVHDSEAFGDVYDKVTQTFPEIETIVADSAYKTPHICKRVFDDGRVLSTAYKRPMTMKGGHEWWKYVYDEHYDCVICPEYQPLSYRTTNRDGYREYRSDPKICAQCPTRQLCTRSKNSTKTVLRHIWKDYEELADDARYMEEGAVLVRNENDALPLSGGEKVTLLGSGVAKPVIHKTPDASRWVDFDAALTAVGFQINITVLNAYKNSPTTRDLQTKDIGEEPISFFTQELRNSFDQYKDVAIVMLSRIAAEGNDLVVSDADGVPQLSLHPDEKDSKALWWRLFRTAAGREIYIKYPDSSWGALGPTYDL